MIAWLLLAVAIVVLCFGFVVFIGAPYLPTLDAQASEALAMIDLKPGDTLLELGSGDGKVMRLAAAADLNVVGYEINPILVIVSRLRTWRYRKQVTVVWGDFWQTKNWPEADGIFTFLLPKYMKKLDTKIIQWQVEKYKPIRLVSFAFVIPDKQPTRQSKSVYLYEYPGK